MLRSTQRNSTITFAQHFNEGTKATPSSPRTSTTVAFRCFIIGFVGGGVLGCGVDGVVASGTPAGLGEGAGWVQDYRQETADVGDCDRAQPAWAFGSVAAVTARKAWASMARVMWRYQGSHLRTW